MDYHPDSIVKSCRKLESGLRLGQEGIHACQLGPFSSPLYWSFEEASNLQITKEMIVEKREQLFRALNSEPCGIPCDHCQMLISKRFDEVDFTRLGHVDLAASTLCNLRCTFCDYTVHNWFIGAKYDALAILRQFNAEDVLWDSAVDFNGGEPTLLANFDDHIEYFSIRRIRVFLYTNSVKYRPSVYDGLLNGSIRWVCTSLDCGTPASFLRIKQRDLFNQVVENLRAYATAGAQGGGNLAVKYIFCEGNDSDEDIAGFVETMRLVRPQKVWLTFDFEPLKGLAGDSEDFCGLDYSRHIAAYAKMYLLLEQSGLETEHFAKRHLAVVSRHGKILLERALAEIERLRGEAPPPLPKPATDVDGKAYAPVTFGLSPLRLANGGQEERPWNLAGKRVAIAPACAAAIGLLSDPEIKAANVVAFIDRDRVLHGKTIEGIAIHGYEEIGAVAPDIILIAAPETHEAAISISVAKHMGRNTLLAVYDQRRVP